MGVALTSIADAAPVRDRELDLLGTERLANAHFADQRQCVKRDLAAIGEPAGGDFEQLLNRMARRCARRRRGAAPPG